MHFVQYIPLSTLGPSTLFHKHAIQYIMAISYQRRYANSQKHSTHSKHRSACILSHIVNWPEYCCTAPWNNYCITNCNYNIFRCKRLHYQLITSKRAPIHNKAMYSTRQFQWVDFDMRVYRNEDSARAELNRVVGVCYESGR